MNARIFLAAFCMVLAAADLPPIPGDWQGSVSYQGVTLHVAFHFQNSGGAWKGTMDAVDQGAKGIPLDAIAVNGARVEFKVPSIGGAYEGAIDAQTGAIAGKWSQNGITLPLELRRGVEKLNRPQEPKPPYPYLSEDVAYDNPQARGVRLAGTFTRPKEGGPFRAVLLITGSGPQNRDEEIMGHKPFLVLADYLTRRGTAVLRVDDRGVGESTGASRSDTTQDFATDVMAGVRFLASRPDVDKKHIGLIGHSEGGIIAPMVAVKMPEVAFIVLLAGSGVPGKDVTADQTYQANLTAGLPPETAALNRDFERKLLDAVQSGNPEKNALALAEGYPGLQEKLRSELPSMLTPWYQFFLRYDPRPTLEQVKCPVLAIDGSKDTQVSADLNLPPIEAALKKGGNKDFTVQKIEGANHLFQTAKTGAVLEYREIEETMSPKVLEIIAKWVEKH